MKRIILLLLFYVHAPFYCFAQDAVEQDTGSFINYSANILWTKSLDDSSSALITYSNNKIFAATNKGNVLCFNIEGSLLWKYSSERTIASGPVDYKGVLIIATLNGDLISLDDSTGEVIQSIGLDEPLTSQLIEFSTSYNGQETEAVLVGSSKGSVFCYDVNSFEMLWENHSASGEIKSKPLEINNKVIYTSGDGFLYCIDSRSGMLIWKWSPEKDNNIPFAECSPVSDGRNVFVCSPDKYLFSIDLMLGIANWKNSSYNCYSSLTISSDKEFLLIKSFKDDFYFVYSKNGKEKEKLSINYGEDISGVPPLEVKDKILFATHSGKVFEIGKGLKSYLLFFMGASPIVSLIKINEDTFAASNSDGNVVVFK